ncbi:MAG: U32 family peptidase [Lachnospiraceae bacterium]|jgi:putative protease|nr:U32 family peptidase [Lachnospiraceae bacterium]
MKEERIIEVLAPAGSFESMKAAVSAGADAVYMGGTRFGARAYAENPETDRLLEAIDYVHLHGKKLYLTVNTLLKEQELSQELYEFLAPVYEAGVDALIVQDLGVWQAVRRWFPDLPLHASTQMTITGVFGAEEARRQGASRIVTARELSIQELQRIHEQVDIEIEAFVHGALCYSYSGQCLFSSLAGGRSGNRGRCAGICRLPYEAWEGNARFRNVAGEYLLNLKDLCGLDSLGELLDAGVCSLKIEGRMKSPRYTAGVVSLYRKYVDLYKKVGSRGWKAAAKDKVFLLELFDRGGFSDGYFHVHNGKHMVAFSERPFRQGNAALWEELDQNYIKQEKKEKIKGNIRIAQDLPVKLSFGMGEVLASVEGGAALAAKSRPISEADVRKQVEKLGESPFVLEELQVELSENCFFPMGGLNELRRNAVSALTEEILSHYRRKRRLSGTGASDREDSSFVVKETDRPSFSVLTEEASQFFAAVREPAVSRVYLPVETFGREQLLELIKVCREEGKECFLALPRIWRSQEPFSWKESGQVDGFLLRNLDEFSLLEEKNCEFVADASLYTFNTEARKALFGRGFAMDTAPLELNRRELLERGMSGSEMIVYGRLPMMVSAQCVQKNLKSCLKKRRSHGAKARASDGTIFLSDRKRLHFPVKQYCRFCYNVIYNSAPLWLAQELPDIAAMGTRMLRLQFMDEGPDEVSRIIQVYEAALAGRNYDYQPGNRTRGHFRRGAE